MNRISRVAQENKSFFLTFIGLAIVGGILLVGYEKVELFLFLNQFHGKGSDFIFFYITHLGDGLVIIPFLLFLILAKASRIKLWISIVSFAAVSLLVQVLKRVVFTNSPRPSALIPHDLTVHWIEGVKLHSSHSFPSGHSATTFAFVTLIALFSNPHQKKYGFLVALLGALVAYSRVYIGQHFLEDVYAGAILGVSVSCLTYCLMYRPKKDL